MESEQMNEFRPLILVAEDDDSNFKLIKAIIGKKCDIEWAKNGQEMVELFQQHQQRAKAMLMDIKMPVMNGLEATKIIRESNTEIPIIMQTAYAFSSDKENAMNAGATEVLVKPITLGILRTTLSKYFLKNKIVHPTGCIFFVLVFFFFIKHTRLYVKSLL